MGRELADKEKRCQKQAASLLLDAVIKVLHGWESTYGYGAAPSAKWALRGANPNNKQVFYSRFCRLVRRYCRPSSATWLESPNRVLGLRDASLSSWREVKGWKEKAESKIEMKEKEVVATSSCEWRSQSKQNPLHITKSTLEMQTNRETPVLHSSRLKMCFQFISDSRSQTSSARKIRRLNKPFFLPFPPEVHSEKYQGNRGITRPSDNCKIHCNFTDISLNAAQIQQEKVTSM